MNDMHDFCVFVFFFFNIWEIILKDGKIIKRFCELTDNISSVVRFGRMAGLVSRICVATQPSRTVGLCRV